MGSVTRPNLKDKPYLWLALLTFAALLVHGYHPAAEDGEIYIPGIKKLLNPALYPFGSEFFLNHARLTQFERLIAATIRISHLPFDLVIFVWYVLSVFLTLLACWDWSVECFAEKENRFAAVALVAALLTLPVAGTSLYIADQYLTPRSFALFAMLFGVRAAWQGRQLCFAAWTAFAILIHPLMAVFGITYGLLLAGMKQSGEGTKTQPMWRLAAFLDVGLLPPCTDAYRAAVQTRSYYFILEWL